MRQLGDLVWVGQFNRHEQYEINCPDCGGTGRLRVMFHDESVASIECATCRKGYEPPTGRITLYRYSASAHLGKITSMEAREGRTRYSVDGYYDQQVFDSEQEALEYAKTLRDEHENNERRRILAKEKDTRSWAWNATYHRRCIKDAEKQIAYHRSKLEIAALKAKEKPE